MIRFTYRIFNRADIGLLPKFAQKDFGQRSRGRRKQPELKQVICLGIRGGIKLVLLVGDPIHCVVELDLSRRSVRFGLEIGFLHPIMDRFPTALDTQVFE